MLKGVEFQTPKYIRLVIKTFIPRLNVNVFHNILSYKQSQCHNVPGH